MDAFLWFDGEIDLINGAKGLVNLAYRRLLPLVMVSSRCKNADLVFEVYGCVEVWDLGVDGLADHLSFGSMHKCAHFYGHQSAKQSHKHFVHTEHLRRWAIALLEASSTYTTPSALGDNFGACLDSNLPPPRPPPLPLSLENPPRPLEPPRKDIVGVDGVIEGLAIISFYVQILQMRADLARDHQTTALYPQPIIE